MREPNRDGEEEVPPWESQGRRHAGAGRGWSRRVLMLGGEPRACKGESPPWRRLSPAREKDNAELTVGPGNMGVSGLR